MKNLFVLLIVVIIFSACNSKKTKQEESGKFITVSILPQKTFVEKISGDDFTVNVLIPPGTSPAAYTLLPSQLEEISKSVIWFRIGYIGFEHSWKDKIEQANTKMKVVDLSEGLDLIAQGTMQHGDHVHPVGVDPHIWLSPVLVKQMAKRILDELSALNPGQSAKYKTNYLEFVKETDQLNIEISNKLKPFEGRKIIVFHPSLSYFARDYGLLQYSLESGGKEPTPQRMTELIDMANNENIKVMYIQGELDRDHAQVFAEEVKGKIIQVRPLDPAWAENLMEMTNIIVDNF
ncbi:MAG: zinc ABC transporter substrate-binding protein [Bacteroidetes bacterium]|nr:MAG: zinc ABC transporter substrate-binding protein [Bacteroidota bacterium]